MQDRSSTTFAKALRAERKRIEMTQDQLALNLGPRTPGGRILHRTDEHPHPVFRVVSIVSVVFWANIDTTNIFCRPRDFTTNLM